MSADLATYIHRQREWSKQTFGPGDRAKGVVAHIRKELVEIEVDPTDLEEWIDVILLAIDGAWRAGHEPEEIAAGIIAKQGINEIRDWPDWRTADPNGPIEHIHLDNVGVPRQNHYGTDRQPWDEILDALWSPEFAAASVLKYLRRTKDPEHSLESARWYHTRLIEMMRGELIPVTIRKISHQQRYAGRASAVLVRLGELLNDDEKSRLK